MLKNNETCFGYTTNTNLPEEELEDHYRHFPGAPYITGACCRGCHKHTRTVKMEQSTFNDLNLDASTKRVKSSQLLGNSGNVEIKVDWQFKLFDFNVVTDDTVRENINTWKRAGTDVRKITFTIYEEKCSDHFLSGLEHFLSGRLNSTNPCSISSTTTNSNKVYRI